MPLSPRRSPHPLPVQAFLPGCGRSPKEAARALPAVAGEEAVAYGLDLLVAGFGWEAHEVLERAWKAAAPDSAWQAHLQGLIWVGARKVHADRGRQSSVDRLSARLEARSRHLQEVAGTTPFGVDWDGVIRHRPLHEVLAVAWTTPRPS